MELKYAGGEILKMAIEIEKNGRAFYDEVVQAVEDRKTKTVFQFLSDEEVKHEKMFRKILQEIESVDEETPFDDSEVTRYFRSLIGQKVFPSRHEGKYMKRELADPSVAARIALSLEKDSILFYHEMVPVTQEKDHAVIERIIEEEREHIRRIIQLQTEMDI
jgi:rubrerythrin